MSTVKHDPEYIAWVKRSLNRLVFAGLKTDGSVNGYYRAWVKEFQYRTGCPTGDGRVDRMTQDYIIAINNVDTNKSSRLYIRWVQEALQLSGFGNGFAADGVMTAATKTAIRTFQTTLKHKHVDGVVGPKTERDLIKRAPGLTVPGFYPGGPKPPIDPVKEREDDWLKNNLDSRSIDQMLESLIELYINEIETEPFTIIDATERQVTLKMLRKFRGNVASFSGTSRFMYLPEQAARSYAIGKYIGDTVSKHTINALWELRHGVGYYTTKGGANARYTLFKRDMNAMYLKIDNGIREIWFQIGTASGVLEGTYASLADWYETKHADSSSIISCFPPPSGGLF
ncbi:MAG: peptidoglycan-binding protein [Pyrinomonadaceae bacterium]